MMKIMHMCGNMQHIDFKTSILFYALYLVNSACETLIIICNVNGFSVDVAKLVQR